METNMEGQAKDTIVKALTKSAEQIPTSTKALPILILIRNKNPSNTSINRDCTSAAIQAKM